MDIGKDEVTHIMKTVDRNDDGSISFAEFKKAVEDNLWPVSSLTTTSAVSLTRPLATSPHTTSSVQPRDTMRLETTNTEDVVFDNDRRSFVYTNRSPDEDHIVVS